MQDQKPIQSSFDAQSTAEQVAAGRNLTGKIVVITGGHSGIGLETTRVLANAGASVIVGARDVQKASEAVGQNARVFQLDLADPASINRFGAQVLKDQSLIHILINNAGIMAVPELVRDGRGCESQFATNHLGHFQLTAKLWPALKAAHGARVVNLTSAGHRYAGVDLEDPHYNHRPYDKWKAYGQSKSANSLFNVALDKRGKEFSIRAFAVHPGRITNTNLLRHMSQGEVSAAIANVAGAQIKTIPQGAATTIWCALSEDLANFGGVYCADCNISPVVPDDSDSITGVRQWAVAPHIAEALWTLSESEIS